MVIRKCNICGNVLNLTGNLDLDIDFGYGSKHDGEHLQLDLCDECFDRVLDLITPMCKLNPWSEQDIEW